MDLKYKTLPESEAGTAVQGCGTIHISEIQPTLTKLSNDLEFPFDLNDYTLGSTGKKEYSGDIDLVLDDKWWGHGSKALKENLDALFGKENVKVYGAMVHLKYPIVGYDPTKDERKPRTGFVQIDFNFGNAEWEKFYHFSPGSESAYKGAHRNLALAAITFAVNKLESKEKDSYDRPEWEVRYKWSPKGFARVHRISMKDMRSGVWMKKRCDTVIEGPHFDPAVIARIIFPVDGTEKDLESLENIMAAVKRNYDKDQQEAIWKRMASNFSDWRDGKDFEYPSEIDQYFVVNDK